MAKDPKPKDGQKPKRGGNPILMALLAVTGLSMLAAIGLGVYVIAAPDDWPKPFYLTLDAPAAQAAEATEPTPAESSAEATPLGPESLPLPGEGLMFDTGTKIVNLADPGGRRYLKVTIVFEFAPHDAAFYTLTGEERAAAVDLFDEDMSTKKPIVDDLLNTLLASKTFEEIYTVEGKEALRQDIAARANALLPGERLMYVYFTEFVVQ